jgi:hypothetical protein
MLIRNGEDFVEILPIERISENLPSMKFNVRIRSSDFIAEGTTWVDLPSVQKFAVDLADLELKRDGKVQLDSMSPNQFRLCVETIDRWGHTAVSGRLVRAKSVRAKQVLEFWFEFDSEYLLQLVSDVRELASPGN